jgi:hypothetical protein
MTDVQTFRDEQLRTFTDDVGVYALCDLDGVPVYVGQSVDGIRTRVRRHLTSARSDIIANRQIDVWEIVYVWAWPVSEGEDLTFRISELEAEIFWSCQNRSALMNGTLPKVPSLVRETLTPAETVQVIPEEERQDRLKPSARLPRQISHYLSLVDYILEVKDSEHLRRSLAAHFDRIVRFHRSFLS